MVALQIGVGSPFTPAANFIVIVSVDPEIVPVNVPLLFRWHALHDPSVGSGAFVLTVPESSLPDSVTVQSTTVVPCESTLVPDHVPARSSAFGCGAGVGAGVAVGVVRSEEHTSELQSLRH